MVGDGTARRTARITIGDAVTVRPASATALPSATSQVFLQPELLSLRILCTFFTSQARGGDIAKIFEGKRIGASPTPGSGVIRRQTIDHQEAL
jgi:hypothetical protein